MLRKTGNDGQPEGGRLVYVDLGAGAFRSTPEWSRAPATDPARTPGPPGAARQGYAATGIVFRNAKRRKTGVLRG